MTEHEKDRIVEIIQVAGVWLCRLVLIGGGVYLLTRKELEASATCISLAVGSLFLIDC